jgi:hypothetical protein
MSDRLPDTQHLGKEYEKFVLEFERMGFELEQISIKSNFQDIFRIGVPFHGKLANVMIYTGYFLRYF